MESNSSHTAPETVQSTITDPSSADAAFETCAAVIVILALSPFLYALRTVSLVFLWKWFVVPLGVPRIGFWHCLGLLLVIQTAVYKSQVFNPKEKSKKGLHLKLKETAGKLIIEGLLLAGMSLFFGWFLKGLM